MKRNRRIDKESHTVREVVCEAFFLVLLGAALWGLAMLTWAVRS